MDFVKLLVLSVVIGIVFGVLLSLFFKKFQSYNENPIKETSIILLCGYSVYLLNEILNLSGIISVFITAIILG